LKKERLKRLERAPGAGAKPHRKPPELKRKRLLWKGKGVQKGGGTHDSTQPTDYEGLIQHRKLAINKIIAGPLQGQPTFVKGKKEHLVGKKKENQSNNPQKKITNERRGRLIKEKTKTNLPLHKQSIKRRCMKKRAAAGPQMTSRKKKRKRPQGRGTTAGRAVFPNQ